MSLPEAQDLLGGDPALSSRFLFEVDGVEIGVFSAIRGLAVYARTEDLREGGQNEFTHRLPGRLEWPNIVFTHGITESDALFEWMNKTSGQGFAANGNKLQRSTGAITVVASNGKRLRAWSLNGVIPVRWSGPQFDSGSSATLSEELEIAHHGFQAANVNG